MAYHVIIQQVRRIGFCCPTAYYKATILLTGAEIGKELRVNKRTANRWRKRIRALGSHPCSPSCLLTPKPPSAPG